MSAAEKKINKSDLKAYKSYDHTDHSMVPGGQNFSKLALKANQEIARENSPPKKASKSYERVQDNQEKLKAHGAIHLGEDVVNLEPKVFRGAGGILNHAMNKP